ncbi:hypothetical protein C0992_001845 [Termitomyces sp. T32_za158]|nr:hypothetical protein C0992_001845 [Termitomyces sp. T32_za158]
MTTPPGDPSAPAASSQPLPQQPPPPTAQPTTPPPKRPRQKKAKPPSPPARVPVAYPPYVMNPYPYHQPYPPQQSPPQPPHQFSYPMHYYSPGPYQYPQMMVYHPPPRNPALQDSPHAPASPAPLKRKRKSLTKGDRSDDDATSGSDARMPPPPHPLDVKKRTKTQRACDSCRSRKIRCDILADAEPPICQHCKQYGFGCTFFLPITETRFRKKKLEEESAAAAMADKDPPKVVSAPHSDSHTSVYGPTSAAHLLHSQASISSRIYETYDARNNHTFEVSNAGDGLITVRKPPVEDTAQLAHAKPVDLPIERETVEQLINAYFTDVAPLLPVITKAEFVATPSPAPILLYSMCLVAAARRNVHQRVFDSIRYLVNTIIKSDEVLSTASIANVQALLILCMTGDCHSQFVPNALSALWIRLGIAIRMAQDLGLHRAESVKQNIELRRRLWGACLISDRWTSLTYGHPSMIDIQDCDARLPSSGDPNELYMDELVRLSVILGRVLKTIYSPSGLSSTTDDKLYALLGDMEAWKAGLPEQLKFRGPETPRTADWLEANDYLYDVWLLVAYAATSCALVQYHTWARRKDDEAAAKLRKLKDIVRRWEGSISPDHMSARRKTAEIIALLYEATQGPHPTVMEAPPLNPTGGVTVKTPVSGLDYKKDPTRPGGGVFVATGQAAREGDFKGVPAGVVISSESESNLGEAGQAPAVSSSIVSASTLNDRDRASLLSTSSSFAPPLPNDAQHQQQQNASPPTSSNVPPMHRGLSMSSSLRSTANNQQGIGGAGSPTSPIVNFTPLGRRAGSYLNMNPAMNMQVQPQSNVQVMNVLDGPQGQNTLQEFAVADNEFLAGIPGSMFDWGMVSLLLIVFGAVLTRELGQWDTFFSRFTGGAASAANMGQGNVAPFQGPRPPS